MKLVELLRQTEQLGGDELWLQAGRKPLVRSPGGVSEIDGERCSASHISACLQQVLPDQDPGSDWYGDVPIPGLGLFRLELQRQAGQPALHLRRVQRSLERSWEELHLPGVLLDQLELPAGLLLLSSPRGGGLTTLVAALLRQLSQTQGQPRPVTSLEDGVELVCSEGVHPIAQREWPGDFRDWRKAVASAARWGGILFLPLEPNLEAALQAAEEGLLVIGYLHAAHSLNALDRLRHRDHAWQRRLANAVQGSYFQVLTQGRDGLLPLGEFLPREACRTALGREESLAYPDWLAGRAGAWSIYDSLNEWAELGALPEPATTT